VKSDLETRRIESVPAALIGAWLAGRTASSRRAYATALERAARCLGRSVETVDWTALDPAVVEAIREELTARGLAPSSINLTLAAIRSLVRHAWRRGLVLDERRARLEDVKGARGSRLPVGRHVEAHELAAVAKACARSGSIVGLRDVALIALAATAGMRRSEIAALDLADLDVATGRVVVRGKGNKQRAVFVSNGALDALRDWIVARGSEPGALFLRLVRQPGCYHAITAKRLSVGSVVDILERRAREADVEPIRPHDLRRTVAGTLLEQGTDIATVARLLGHANVQTTARYDRRPEAAVAQAAAKLRFPYRAIEAR
jgi:site-specific recombinase XerD